MSNTIISGLINSIRYLPLNIQLKMRLINKKIARLFAPRKIYFTESYYKGCLKNIKEVYWNLNKLCEIYYRFNPSQGNVTSCLKFCNRFLKFNPQIEIIRVILGPFNTFEFRKLTRGDLISFENLYYYKGNYLKILEKCPNIEIVHAKHYRLSDANILGTLKKLRKLYLEHFLDIESFDLSGAINLTDLDVNTSDTINYITLPPNIENIRLEAPFICETFIEDISIN